MDDAGTLNTRNMPDNYKKTFQKRYRSLELLVWNRTKHGTLKFAEEYFASGTWFENFLPSVIPPEKHSTAFVTNKPGVLAGVKGGLMFNMDVQGTRKYLSIGFANPVVGGYKTYISIKDDDLGAKNGFDNAKNDKHKLHTIGEFVVEANLTTPREGGNKQMIFIVSDVPDVDVTA